MRKALVWGILTLCVCGVAGCGGGGTYASQMRVVAKDYRELTEACKTVKQEAQFTSMLPRLQSIYQRLKDDCGRLKALEPDTDQAKIRLQKKYGPLVMTLRFLLFQEETRLTSLESGKIFVAEELGEKVPIPLPVVNGSPLYQIPVPRP